MRALYDHLQQVRVHRAILARAMTFRRRVRTSTTARRVTQTIFPF